MKVARYPTVGEPTVITLEAPADQVTITYSPGAPIATTQTLSTGGKLEVPWTPETPGVASVVAGADSTNVSVKFDGVPGLGLVIFLIAGVILFGGAAVCLRALFAGSSEQ